MPCKFLKPSIHIWSRGGGRGGGVIKAKLYESMLNPKHVKMFECECDSSFM